MIQKKKDKNRGQQGVNQAIWGLRIFKCFRFQLYLRKNNNKVNMRISIRSEFRESY